MSQLKPTQRFAGERARKDEAKEQRRRTILDAARAVYARRGISGFKMSEVAQRAGVVAGTLYLYWKTREELLLSLLEQTLGEWLDDLDARLDTILDRGEKAGARRMTAVFVETLTAHEHVPRLLAVLQTVLEHNVKRPAIERFKRFLIQRVGNTGQRLEQHMAALKPAEGLRVMLHLNALVSGLQQMAEAAPVVREVLRDPELAPLAVSFAPELRIAMETYFFGIESRGRSGAWAR